MNTHAYTPMHIQDLINRTAMEANILPLTSRCDSACIFLQSSEQSAPGTGALRRGTLLGGYSGYHAVSGPSKDNHHR